MGSVQSVRILHAPKDGSREDEYEDAFAVSPREGELAAFGFALADGASAAVFARQWANLLVGGLLTPEAGFPDVEDDFRTVVTDLGQTWRREVEAKATSWHAQEKMNNGSSAAFLVVTCDLSARSFCARSVGDVCLFVVRNDKLKYAFPMTKSASFSDRPALVSTEAAVGAPVPKVVRFEGSYESGDRFLAMTDAWAAYFLGEWEAKRKPWQMLPADESQIGAYLKARRDNGKLKNDDVTLIDAIL